MQRKPSRSVEAHVRPSDRISLRPLADSDSPLLHAWINDRKLVELSARFRPISEDEHRKWFCEIRRRSDIRIFAIADAITSDTIGYCQLKAIDLLNRSAELQIRIGSPGHQGRGLGTAAVLALLDVAFDELGLHRVYLHVFEHNQRARRCYEKCGFRLEGLARDAVFIDDTPISLVMMAVLRGERLARTDPSVRHTARPSP
jgi:RimJ/RimL family protein N-acetyltransferase